MDSEDDIKMDESIDNNKMRKIDSLKSVCDLIRFGLMDSKYFANNIIPLKILSIEDAYSVLLYYQNPSTNCGIFNTERRVKAGQHLSYELRMSTKYTNLANTYDALINDDLSRICGTKSGTSWIEARFGSLRHIVSMDIAPPMNLDWSVNDLNGRLLQYSLDGENWITLFALDGFRENETRSIRLNINARALRVYGKGWMAIGKWKVYGSQ